MLAQEIIRRKRDGHVLTDEHIGMFVRGLVDASWSDAQVAAMAMALFVQGLSDAETVALTRAMTASGEALAWAEAALPGPVLDKHSTGGVGDKISLILGPVVAACGGYVPMISGRGLGHTGGTLDKLDSIPGYRTAVPAAALRDAVRKAGCAIVGATGEIAPADARLYAIRDVTATVESIPLITASILAKKLAAGLQGLVMDVKSGNGAFAADPAMARALARSLVRVAKGAGLTTRAWITDMNQVLGCTCGNALEVREALEVLRQRDPEPRLLAVTRALSAELLCIGGLADTTGHALERVDAVLADGRALERFARMVAALGGPSDFVERSDAHLPVAPVQRAVVAPRAGWVAGMATREIGVLVVELGGGRRRAGDAIDHRVGLSDVVAAGRRVEAGDPLAIVHAADRASAEAGCARLAEWFTIADAPAPQAPALIERLTEEDAIHV